LAPLWGGRRQGAHHHEMTPGSPTAPAAGQGSLAKFDFFAFLFHS
jgi:hypothetical protein